MSLVCHWHSVEACVRIDSCHNLSLVEADMLTIRLSKTDWAKAWRAMIEIAPVRLIADDPIYEVLPAHVQHLIARGFQYEVVEDLNGIQH